MPSLKGMIASAVLGCATLAVAHPLEYDTGDINPLASDAETPLDLSVIEEYARLFNESGISHTPIGNHTSGDAEISGIRDELDPHHVCAHWYHGFFDQWIVQMPPEWWEEKYKGFDGAVCWDLWRRVNAVLTGKTPILQECWRMESQYLSAAPGWIHMRFTTVIGAHGSPVVDAINSVRDMSVKRHFEVKCIRR